MLQRAKQLDQPELKEVPTQQHYVFYVGAFFVCQHLVGLLV